MNHCRIETGVKGWNAVLDRISSHGMGSTHVDSQLGMYFSCSLVKPCSCGVSERTLEFSVGGES